MAWVGFIGSLTKFDRRSQWVKIFGFHQRIYSQIDYIWIFKNWKHSVDFLQLIFKKPAFISDSRDMGSKTTEDAFVRSPF